MKYSTFFLTVLMSGLITITTAMAATNLEKATFLKKATKNIRGFS